MNETNESECEVAQVETKPVTRAFHCSDILFRQSLHTETTKRDSTAPL
jgi:hypothetical protein